MRIGITCNHFAHSGGMEQYALSLVEALLELGHQPVVFTMDVDTSLPFYSDCEVHQCLTAWLPNKLKVVKFGRWFEHISRDMKLDTSIACSLTPGAEIDCCGGTHIGYLKAMKRSPWFYDRWTIATERRLYSRAKLIVAHADIMKQELRDFYGINPDKITTLYPPLTINTQDTDQTRSELRRHFHLPDDKTLFLFPSSSHKRKGFPLLKDYFEKGNGEELLIVAGRPPKGECKNTLYVGYCNEMPLLYKACDYTILASSYEPFGMVGPESVANGTPVIFGENIGCYEIIDRKARVTFNVSDAESLASAGISHTLGRCISNIGPPFLKHWDSPLRRRAS